MKRLIVLGLVLLSTSLTFAQNSRNGAELFIEIENRGNFTVYVDNESVESAKGRFRFYDVFNTNPTISIISNNKTLLTRRLNTKPGKRLVFSYNGRSGLSLVKELSIYRNRQYALDDFDNYTDGYNTGTVPPRPNNDDYNATGDFNRLLEMVKKSTFDDDKLSIVKAYSANYRLSTVQVSTLLKTFLGDDKQLEVAKHLYPSVTDGQNYFTLADIFTFSDTKQSFLSFVSNQQGNDGGRPNRNSMSQNTYNQLYERINKEPFDDEKTRLIKLAIQNSFVSTSQITGLLKLYSFEEKALECARQAYMNVYDRQKYYTISDIFTFKSNRDAFLDFLERNK